ncbi:winged helix-turn-helix transcriptional regulator [Microlunatus speluncae]|uniref:winged helix-turn-helix transcriptional regulator n=1 Tax=Microlunatus speluncae TaxID=2594267 RepID=UPI00126636B0|nr:helix-turn-helix domain-containing protein [Microlunatus speluncae]
MALGKDYADQDCGIARTLEIIGERWTALIVRDCLYGVTRFSDLQVHLDISKAVLADRLESLVANGVLEKLTGEGHPEYVLTRAGRDLWPLINAMAQWGNRHGTGGTRTPTRAFRHADCGSLIDINGFCTACKIIPEVTEIISTPERASRRTDPVTQRLREPRRLLDPLR